MKEQQLLRDSGTEPTSEIIAEGLGAANSTYIKFIEELKNYNIQVYWRYYNDGKAQTTKKHISTCYCWLMNRKQ